MTKDDVIAELALRDYNKRAQLRELVFQSGWHYYTGGSMRGIGFLILSAVIASSWLLRDSVPAWGWAVSLLALGAFLEAGRQRARFEALLELQELEKSATPRL